MTSAISPRPGRLQVLADYLKIEHTLFSVPLIYAGALLAPSPLTFPTAVLILISGTGARAAALGLNRILDRELDARNPRTAGRALPAGDLSLTEAKWSLGISIAVYLVAAGGISPLCLIYAPIPLIVFTVYPLLKRWTRWAHLGVGAGLALGPLAAFFAVALDWNGALPVLFLAGFTFFWSSGFDILYSSLDEASDRAEGVNSLPAALGSPGAFRISRLFHTAAFLFLMLLHFTSLDGLAGLILFGVTGILFVVQHVFHQSVEIAFFKVNAALGMVVFAGVALAAP